LTERSKLIWVYLIALLFILLNSYLIVKEFYWGAFLPVVIFIVLLYFISLDKVLLLITFLTPFAVTLKDTDLGLGVSLPTEPLMFGVLVFFIIKLLYEGNYDRRVLKHPVTIAILINLIWLLFTSITSELPVVSFKFLLSRLWFVVPFYFVAVLLFKNYAKIKLFIWLYVVPLTGVIGYTVYNHALHGFDEDSGHWVMTPFYNDHTAYGAVLAMFIPVLFGFSIDKKYSASTRAVSAIFFIIFVIAIILSYSRAAWLSLAVAMMVLVLVLLKIKFRWVLITGVLFFGLFFAFQQQILEKLERNKQDSSANFVEHVQSIANITSDASNLERINRWQSALRMFRERPFWGWGPGTYQFMYAPFQMSREKTIISTNAGDRGNAHSEYIGPLAETGVIGSLSVIFIFGMVIYRGLKLYASSKDKEVKLVTISVLLGLITYFSHGFLNNFLDTDKASVPFWGFIAVLVALDVYHHNKKEVTA